MADEQRIDKGYVERNREQRERLRALVERLSDEDLARPLGDGAWTVGATLAHLAYWDQRGVGALEATQRHGLPLVLWSETDALGVNQALTPAWRSMDGREAARWAMAASAALDATIETLSDEMVAEVTRIRFRMLDRSVHRVEHLGEIERGLAGEA